jgi:hypothetical protein
LLGPVDVASAVEAVQAVVGCVVDVLGTEPYHADTAKLVRPGVVSARKWTVAKFRFRKNPDRGRRCRRSGRHGLIRTGQPPGAPPLISFRPPGRLTAGSASRVQLGAMRRFAENLMSAAPPLEPGLIEPKV